MERSVPAAEANRSFSRLLRSVEQGDAVTITRHGRPVARITPCADDKAARDKAWAEMIEHLRQQPALNTGPWTREELYER